MFDEHWILLDNIPLEEMRVLELHPEIDDPELSVGGREHSMCCRDLLILSAPFGSAIM